MSAVGNRAARGMGRFGRLTVLTVTSLLFLVPLLWLVLAPSKTGDALESASPLSFGHISHFWTAWQNLATYSDHNTLIARWFLNSLLYASASTLIVLAVGLPAGYALAVYRFPGRRLILGATLFLMILPAASLVLPLYLELDAMHLIGSPASVVLPLSFYPFGTFLAYIFFSTTLPPSLLAAARIDGCSEGRLFLQIALPLARSVAPVIMVFSFLRVWNEFFLPYLTLVDEDLYPLPVGLVSMASTTGAFRGPNAGFAGFEMWPIGRPELALASLLSIIPVLCLFVFSQRFLRSGILGGSSR
jgi:multiple sugar transport system permease protein